MHHKLFSLILPCLLGFTQALAAASGDARQSSAELAAVKKAIERVSRELNERAAARDREGTRLRAAEQEVAAARSALQGLQKELAAVTAQRTIHARERESAAAQLVRRRSLLSEQLRVAYLLGNSEPLKLLLGQRDASMGGRLLVWHGYLGKARAAEINAVQQLVLQLETMDQQLASSELQLQQLRSARQQALAAVDTQRQQRQKALTALQRESQSRSVMLAKLRNQQADIEKLLRELSTATRQLPAPASSGAFGKLRGQLPWPVDGRLVARYGQPRVSGVPWEGVVVATERAAPVRAVAAGRVVYADWLSGMGLLTIVDHGAGYLSLYAYNDELRAGVGDRVNRGDQLATAGDTGGRTRPELYFEIRRAGKPVDPQPWFSSRAP